MKEDGAICLTSSLTLPQNAVSLALSQSGKLNIMIHYITKNITSCSFTNILPMISMEEVGTWSDLSLSGITWFKKYVTVKLRKEPQKKSTLFSKITPPNG